MPLAGFEPAVPASERPQTLSLDRSGTGIGFHMIRFVNILVSVLRKIGFIFFL
jgi:hypothetical protein